ncbi:GNAT family N-acetyltransferase [Aeromicrobium sp.]|uniref:GNAT family N-acetyltransferase n=1 Tax=Aeromicrobium sp. TaxID=1871063 RepID=UPI0035127F1D
MRSDPAAFAASAHRWLGDLDVETRWRERLDAVVTYVACLDGTDVGTAGVGADHELLGMWVAPAARGTGVADRLVDAVARHAGAGAPLHLRVMAGNDVGVRFYTRCGFVVTDPEPDAEGCLSMIRAR